MKLLGMARTQRTCTLVLMLLALLGISPPDAVQADHAGWTLLGSKEIVRAVALDPVDERVVYAAGPAGLRKTTDGGATWTLVDSAPIGHRLVVDPQTPLTLYATASSKPDLIEDQVLRTTSGGVTWEIVYNVPGRSGELTDLLVDPNGTGAVFTTEAGASGHPVLRSLDGGVTWITITDPLLGVGGGISPNATSLAMLPGRPNLLYAAITTYHNPQVGKALTAIAPSTPNWTWIPFHSSSLPNDGLEYAVPTIIRVARSPSDTVLYAFWTGNGTAELTRSVNDGAWEKLGHALPYLGDRQFVPAFTAMEVDPQRADLVYAAVERAPSRVHLPMQPSERRVLQHGIFSSPDGGQTWAEIGQLDVATNGLALAVHSHALYAATDEGVYRFTATPVGPPNAPAMPQMGGGGTASFACLLVAFAANLVTLASRKMCSSTSGNLLVSWLHAHASSYGTFASRRPS